jgi:hypothetical protein
MKREPLQAAWEIALGDLRRRRPELVDFKSYRQAFRNAAAEVVARAHIRGLGALPSKDKARSRCPAQRAVDASDAAFCLGDTLALALEHQRPFKLGDRSEHVRPATSPLPRAGIYPELRELKVKKTECFRDN